MKARIPILLAALLLLCACHSEAPVPPETPSAPEEPVQTAPIPEPETVPVLQPAAEPKPEPAPEPQLHEPLWDGAMELQVSHQIQRTADTVTVFEGSRSDSIHLRLYQMEGGDRVTMGRVDHAAGEIAAYTWEISSDGVLRWYDRSAGQWQEQPFAAGETRASMIELAAEDGSSFLIYLPKTYRPQENGVLEYLPQEDGKLSIAKVGDVWRFTLLTQLPDTDCVSDFTMVQGSRPMLNWEHSYCGELWKVYTMETEGKWCFDGYYWPCPDNYIPTGENYLYGCPAAYLLKSFAYASPVHPAADNLALAMLDTMSTRQNDDGFWETSPASQWLLNDYGVEKGFYDTRFNTDLMEIYRVYYEYAGGDIFLDTMQAHTDFFLDFAERAHFTTEQGGWFIPDYDPAVRTPHSSLNHQLAECIELYHLSEILQRPELETLADRMLLAVTDTGKRWIKENGDLHYCIFPDGSMGLQDYPYLTYNDLFELQNLLIQRRGAPEETLRLLMEQKRQWMDANGITGYQK